MFQVLSRYKSPLQEGFYETDLNIKFTFSRKVINQKSNQCCKTSRWYRQQYFQKLYHWVTTKQAVHFCSHTSSRVKALACTPTSKVSISVSIPTGKRSRMLQLTHHPTEQDAKIVQFFKSYTQLEMEGKHICSTERVGCQILRCHLTTGHPVLKN